MSSHKTVFDLDFVIKQSDYSYSYQDKLTPILDQLQRPFDQQVINEIVLWKVNRFASVSDQTLELLNRIDPGSIELEIDLTTEVLKALLVTKGIQLPMASTIMRFKNKNIYQILDQRVYRIIYPGLKLRLSTHGSVKNLEDQVELYLKYLCDLRAVCGKLNIPFVKSDRILYEADKRMNKNIPLDNYSSKADKTD